MENLKQIVRRGNVVRDLDWLQKGMQFVPVYVANGAVGGCLDEWGLHHRCNYDMDCGRTHLTHVDHYSRWGKRKGHVLRSFGHLIASDMRGRPLGLGLAEQWEQQFDLWTASCTSDWAEGGSKWQTHVFASWAQPQLWCWSLKQQPARPEDALRLRWCFDVRQAENNARSESKLMHELSVRIEPAGADLWKVTSQTNCHQTQMLLYVRGGQCSVEASDLLIDSGPEGVTMRALFLDEHLPESIAEAPEDFLARDDHREAHEQAVGDHWQSSGMLDLPSGPEANWWPRLAYYLPASLSPNPSHVQIATALNANNWAYGFPQDQWYVMMALPRLGLHDLTAAQLPFYSDDLDAYRRYAKRLAKREGVFFPWEPPFEDLDAFEVEDAPGVNAYQFHSAAYPVAMAWESFLVHRDEAFLQRHSEMIQGVAEFLASNCQPGENGYVFGNDDVPLRSQDEGTTHGAQTVQPICAVWSSMYCFKAFLEMRDILGTGDEKLARKVGEILETGFDFGPLIGEDGLLRTSGTDERPLGLQKHPPQLNPVTYVPMAKWMDETHVRASWQRRYELCKATREPKSLGWTFGQFLLTSVRMADGQAAQKDLGLVMPARFADPDWIQFYETSDRNGWTHKWGAYYFTVMGLYVMALLDAIVQDYRDRIDLLPAPLPRWKGKPIAFSNLHLRGGLVLEGKTDDGRLECSLRASKDFAGPLRVHLPGRYRLSSPTETEDFQQGQTVQINLAPGQTARIESIH
jgi:hypothetical protein